MALVQTLLAQHNSQGTYHKKFRDGILFWTVAQKFPKKIYKMSVLVVRRAVNLETCGFKSGEIDSDHSTHLALKPICGVPGSWLPIEGRNLLSLHKNGKMTKLTDRKLQVTIRGQNTPRERNV